MTASLIRAAQDCLLRDDIASDELGDQLRSALADADARPSTLGVLALLHGTLAAIRHGQYDVSAPCVAEVLQMSEDLLRQSNLASVQ